MELLQLILTLLPIESDVPPGMRDNPKWLEREAAVQVACEDEAPYVRKQLTKIIRHVAQDKKGGSPATAARRWIDSENRVLSPRRERCIDAMVRFWTTPQYIEAPPPPPPTATKRLIERGHDAVRLLESCRTSAVHSWRNGINGVDIGHYLTVMRRDISRGLFDHKYYTLQWRNIHWGAPFTAAAAEVCRDNMRQYAKAYPGPYIDERGKAWSFTDVFVWADRRAKAVTKRKRLLP